MQKKEMLSYINLLTTGIIAVTLFLLPLFFLLNTTDFFILPKQVLIVFVALALLVVSAARMILEKKIVILSNPFNLPVALFGLVILASSILSVNRFDALLQTIPVVALILFFFAIVNNIREKNSLNIATYSLTAGAELATLLSILYYFKLYFLPFPQIQSQGFTPFGSSIQEALYIIPVLIFSVFLLIKKTGFPKIRVSVKSLTDKSLIFDAIATIILLAGIILVAYQIIALPQKPVILPYIYGFQTAFAAMSQDTSRFILSFLFGSGYGTFLSDFTRFKSASFNLEQSIWNLNFSFSSSYFLELVATTGLAGLLSYLHILVTLVKNRAAKNPFLRVTLLLFGLSLILPFSFINIALLFIMLGLYTSFLTISQDKRVDEVSLSIVAFKKGLFAFEEGTRRSEESVVLSVIVAALLLGLAGFVGFYTLRVTSSDIKFAESLQQANLNNGQKTYQLQTSAITEFSYRSDYHRIFSQVNLALANSLSSTIPQGSKPSDQVQQNIIQLLQQSIQSGRNAVTLSPLSSTNWQNLGQIYRNLINIGQNADQFAVASLNQAIALDPYNPQLYIQLGGIYYQLGQYDQAQTQFQLAINLKRDFANGYYNLGHALEQKGDYQNAFQAYQIVKQLVKNDKTNLDLINTEIDALQKKTQDLEEQKTADIKTSTNQAPLDLSTPSTELPPQKPPISISPPPPATVEKPATSPTPSQATPTPTPAQ